MKVKCSFCGNWIKDGSQKCPYCGAANEHYQRVGNGVPTTIEELQQWATAHHLPLKDMRTYIGKDYRGARAFGIYQDKTTGHFIVYKNKEDGTRSVRYEGDDEAYAVNELYLKMKERVAIQKSHQKNTPNNPKKSDTAKRGVSYFLKKMLWVLIFLFGLNALIFWCMYDDSLSSGYYSYEGESYYYQDENDSWYYYDFDDAEWMDSVPDSTLQDNANDYYVGHYYSDDSVYSDFTDSQYYIEDRWDDDSEWSTDSDWDSDTTWDSGSDWDSSYDDWGSDW